MSDFDLVALIAMSAAFSMLVWGKGTAHAARALEVDSPWLARLVLANKVWMVVIGGLLVFSMVLGASSGEAGRGDLPPPWIIGVFGLAVVLIAAATGLCTIALRRDAARQGLHVPLSVDASHFEPLPHEKLNVSLRRIFIAGGVVVAIWFVVFVGGMWLISRGM